MNRQARKKSQRIGISEKRRVRQRQRLGQENRGKAKTAARILQVAALLSISLRLAGLSRAMADFVHEGGRKGSQEMRNMLDASTEEQFILGLVE